MQQLCAKTIYGGAPAGQHLGGWCSRGLKILDVDVDHDPLDDFHIEEGDAWLSAARGVSFDASADAHASKEGQDARFLLDCFNR